jgi:signal transduction histidine kinase
MEDVAGKLSIEEVAARSEDFVPIPAVLSRGYTSSVWWLKLEVPAAPAGEPMLLRFRQSFLDHVTLFSPRPDGSWEAQTIGDRHPYVERPYRSLKLAFVVEPSAPGATYYVRVQTASTMLVDVEAVPLSEASEREVHESVLNVVALSILAVLAVLGAIEYVRSRERMAALYLLFQVVSLLATLGALGYFALIAPPGYPESADLMLTFALLAYPCIASAVHFTFIREYAPAPLILRLLWVARWYLPIGLVLIALGHAGDALFWNAILVAALAPTALAAAMSAKRDLVPSRRTVVVVYTLMLAVFAIAVLSPLGVLPNSKWNAYLAVPVATSTGALLFFLIFRRAEEERSRRTKLAVALERAQFEANVEREQREQRTRFMSTLNHEMRTPLAVLQMALPILTQNLPPRSEIGRHAEKAAQDLGGMVNRVVNVDRLDSEPPSWRPESCDIRELLAECRASAISPVRVRVTCETRPVIESNREAFALILSNLLDNALRYSPPTSTVVVTAQERSREGRNEVCIAVENECGSAGAPDSSQVFQKYYRAPGAHHESGLGLGLYLARITAQRLGGDLCYAGGDVPIRFELWLPV